MTAITRKTASAQHAAHDFIPLRSQAFNALGGIRHGITRRIAGVLPAEANISFSAPRDQHAAWTMRQQWCLVLGVDPSTLVVPRQVHGSNVAIAGPSDAGAGASPGSTLLADADAIVSGEPGVTLMTTHADCLPLLMYAPRHQVIAAVHAGWRSTVTNVAGAAVSVMTSAFGVPTADVHAFIGPAICAACYEVGTDVLDAWQELDGDDAAGAIHRHPGSTSFDLVAANQYLLRRSGVPSHQIEYSNICTKCQADDWFSHRAQGPGTGRFGAIIALDNASR